MATPNDPTDNCGTSHCSTFAFTDEHLAYVQQYGGMCRDCADECGVCPRSGLPCGQSRKAIKHVLEAIQYGVRHGFVSSPANTTNATDNRVEIKHDNTKRR